MFNDATRKELTDIIFGNVIESRNDTLTSVRNNLCQSFETSAKAEKKYEQQAVIKEKQKKHLTLFANQHQLWFNHIDESQYLTEGGEAKIYFEHNSQTVVKLNDAVYYNNWLDFFNSVLIHNLIFQKTAYTLLGFIEKENCLHAVLEQTFIVSEQQTDLSAVKIFLEYNGFKNVRNNDYYNEEFGLILEDMHDENVLTNSNVLFFIDTVFYIHLTTK